MRTAKPASRTSPSIRPSNEPLTYKRGCGRGDESEAAADCSEVLTGEETTASEEGHVEIEAEDVQPRQTLITPTLPTQQEIDDHMVDHTPYRAWCDACVAGRGQETPHRPVDPDRRNISVVSFDYFFVTSDGMYLRKDWDKIEDRENRSYLKVLVVQDSMHKNVFAHGIERKGADDDGYAVQCIVQDIQWLGFTKVILKSDNEKSIVRLLRESLKALRVDGECADGQGMEQVGEEHPPPYDPQANGAVEAAVKSVKGLMRTMLYGLQVRLKRKIPPTHPVVAWLASHSASVHRWRTRGTDGRTPYERARGRPFSTRLAEFGEYVKYKIRQKPGIESSNLNARWSFGIFFGNLYSDWPIHYVF